MVAVKATEPNPDGLDEVFNAYQTLRSVLSCAVLVPNPADKYEEDAANAQVGEAMDMLGAWLSEECGKGLEVRE